MKAKEYRLTETKKGNSWLDADDHYSVDLFAEAYHKQEVESISDEDINKNADNFSRGYLPLQKQIVELAYRIGQKMFKQQLINKTNE